jgi:putative CRISPR-associated protein (TIGR02619 family)
MHYLVATDTYLGRAAADLVAEWLGQRFVVVQRLDIQDLRVDDPDSFRLGMSALAEWCASTLPGFRSAGHAILFNLTGGFKPVQAFLQTLGMFHADESFYVFEGAETPMRIPRLPIRLDIEDSVRRNLEAFRRLDRQEELPASDCADVPETLLGRVGDRVALSPWGALAFKTARPAIFGAALLDPLSERVVYSNRFRDEVRDLAPDRREALNVQLDRLSRHLEGGENPRSLQFKALSGDPRPPSTHEAYAWSDRDARRILGHFEGARFVIDQLSVHL